MQLINKWLVNRTIHRLIENSTLAHYENVNNCIPLQDVPSPVYPSLHAQVKEPSVFEQIADVWQLWVLDVHSSVSSDQNKKELQKS